jgi:hypothetical protein
MHLMGLEAIYPKPRLSQAGMTPQKYPYLLRGLCIERVNQVWSTDITYIRLQRGFLYLVAILDWFSRYVLSWSVSITLDTSFCLEALEAALAVAQPEIFNSDQGGAIHQCAVYASLAQRRHSHQLGWAWTSLRQHFCRTRAPMRMYSPCWRSPTPPKQTWIKHFLTWRRKPKGTGAWKESTVREALSPKRLCQLGRIGLALHWANVRRLVAGEQPEGHGAIASA